MTMNIPFFWRLDPYGDESYHQDLTNVALDEGVSETDHAY